MYSSPYMQLHYYSKVTASCFSQDQSLETVAARRTMIARPTLRFAKINAFIQSMSLCVTVEIRVNIWSIYQTRTLFYLTTGAMKISSIYGLNVDAITHSGSEQELCKVCMSCTGYYRFS